VMVVPEHTRATWWHQLSARAVREPLTIGTTLDLLPPEGWRNRDRDQRPPNWKLVAILLN
jgi:hypothetical protein